MEPFKLNDQVILKLGEEIDHNTIISQDCEFNIPAHTLPVTVGFNKDSHVGFAHVKQIGSELVADLTITDEKLQTVLGALDKNMYGTTCAGKIIRMNGKLVEEFIPTDISIEGKYK
jgi:hypothetical protein